nr:type II toxin-antitoxin system PemK/MazF family toxin [Glaciimonas immobilis]
MQGRRPVLVLSNLEFNRRWSLFGSGDYARR